MVLTGSMPRNVNKNKRLLVLTSATGAGHDTHANATAAWCKEIYGETVEVRIDHTLEDSHSFNRGGVEFYNLIQRRAPWFHHIYYNVIELLELLNHGTVGFGKDYYVRLLEEFRPDAVLSVHDCLNLGYFEVAREVLGPECALWHLLCGIWRRIWLQPQLGQSSRRLFFWPDRGGRANGAPSHGCAKSSNRRKLGAPPPFTPQS